MKTKLFFITALFLISFGCKEGKKIEIIPANEVYFTSNELDVLSEIIVRDKEGKAILEITKKVKELYDSLNETDKESFKVDYRFLVNENGYVDKIQIVESKYPQFDKLMIETAEIIQFTPAIKDGEKVKSIFPWRYEHKILSNLNLNLIPPNQDFNQDVYFVAVEQMPELIGGLKSIQEKIVYPKIAKRTGIEGKVFVLAFIDEKGNVVNAKILKGIGAGCDEAALNAVKETKFTPGKQRGKPVKTQVSIPIMFKLQ